MSLSRQHALTLPAAPRAVKLAREWVARVLAEIGRDDLVRSAELGVSELVTNAIMHSSPPVAVRVRGSHAHPRIEVADRSLVPPRPLEPVLDLDLDSEDDDILLTFGRGLALVALHSACWGSDIDAYGMGKTVWFEPVGEPRDDSVVIEGDLFDLNQLMADRYTDADPADVLEIHLLAAPVTALADVRRQYNELRRELRLLALANPQRYPLAASFSETALQAEFDLRRFRGVDVLVDAEHENHDRRDLVLSVPRTMPETISELRVLLEEVYAFFDSEQLLVGLPSPRQQQVQAWYLGEFVRQGGGSPPSPWTGGYREHRGGAQTA